MSAVTTVRKVKTEDRFTQKCVIPIRFLEDSDFKIKDYVTLQTSEKIYVCQLYVTVESVTCIYIDDTVTSVNFKPAEHHKQSEENIEWPTNMTRVKVSTFDVITIKIVYDSKSPLFCHNKNAYEDEIHKILSRYIVGKNCIINCSGLKSADLLHVHSIIVSETIPAQVDYGRVIKNTKLNIIDFFSLEQMRQIEEFKLVQLGGMSDSINILKLNLIIPQSNRILISGPSGSGKSSFVKKFCSNMNCFFVFIDGLKLDLTREKLDEIYQQFFTYLKIFPGRTCILFIDHINVLAPYYMKSKSSFYMLMDLMNNLTDLNVFIIAVACHKTDISTAVSAKFTREINLGIPSFLQRKDIVEVLAKSLNCDINSDKIAQMTPGFLGHDILSLIKRAIHFRKGKEPKEVNLLHLMDEDFEKALDSISPSVLKTSVWNMKVKPVYWKDIGGMFGIKQKLQMCVEWPLRNPELFKKVDLPCPHGVLLFGPPGCCKTTLARGLATECNANFFAANPAQIYSSYVGESEKNITQLFYQARLCSPSIIFLDELDSLVSQRKLDTKNQGIGEKVLSCLLNEMDGFGTRVLFQNNLNMLKLLQKKEKGEAEELSSDVIVVAATNRPDLIDDALLRPGRFDIILYVSPPNEEERESILLTLTEKMPVKSEIMKKIAAKTDLFSGADLKSLCNEATMNALRQNMAANSITEENFLEALRKIQPSITKQQIEMYEKLSSKYGTVVK